LHTLLAAALKWLCAAGLLKVGTVKQCTKQWWEACTTLEQIKKPTMLDDESQLGKCKLSPESEKNGWVDFMGMLLHPRFPVQLEMLLGGNSVWPLFCNHLVESWEKSWEDERRINALVEKGGISWSQLDKTDTQKLESVKFEATGGQVITFARCAGLIACTICAVPRTGIRLLRCGCSEKDAKLAQKLGQLQPSMAVFLLECMGQLAYLGPT
jgi:hypothetical protein